jgi:YgiT-type zinc finger domain-containing protein
MNTCVICKTGKLAPGRKTILIDREGMIVIFKDAPGDVCNKCSEIYLDGHMTDMRYQLAIDVFEKGAELEIISIKNAA